MENLLSTTGQNKIAEILINNGADINIKDKSGQTPLIEAVEQGLRGKFNFVNRVN